MKRIFVAIRISPKLSAEVLKWRGGHLDLPVRWIKEDNLHLTLLPPWEASEEEIEDVLAKLEPIGGVTAPFGLHFTDVTSGPTLSEANLIMATGEAPKAIVELKELIEKRLGVSGESRPYMLHLTLARVRPRDISQFLRDPFEQPVSWKETVESFELMESILLPEGAEYKTVGVIRLSHVESD
jgi:2'-5' RNA ligase